jgi:hypothetical protein
LISSFPVLPPANIWLRASGARSRPSTIDYDRIVTACEQAGFQPRLQAFPDPPVSAMLARLPGGREIGLAPASLAVHAAESSLDVVARDIVDPVIQAELSILWPARAASPAVAHFLDSARRCATNKGWVAGP